VNLVREAYCGENVAVDILNGSKAILSLSFCLRLTYLIIFWLIVLLFRLHIPEIIAFGKKIFIYLCLYFDCSQVKDLYGLDDEVAFRNVTVSSENRPQPLSLGTATQIG
jgi:hypothetical protein